MFFWGDYPGKGLFKPREKGDNLTGPPGVQEVFPGKIISGGWGKNFLAGGLFTQMAGDVGHFWLCGPQFVLEFFCRFFPEMGEKNVGGGVRRATCVSS